MPRNLTFSPGGALPGFQLAESEVAHLRNIYSPIAGPDGIQDLFLVIDVVGGAGHPPVRFVYATRVADPHPNPNPNPHPNPSNPNPHPNPNPSPNPHPHPSQARGLPGD